MIRTISFLLLIIYFSSCSKKEISIPENVLKQKEMVSILTEVQIAQASVVGKSVSDSSKITTNDYLIAILKNHNTKKEDFLFSLKFYTDNPEILQEVYDSVLTGLSRIEAATEK